MAVKVKLKTQIKQIEKIRGKQVKRAEKATAKTLERFGAIVRQDSRKLIGPPAKGPKFEKVVVDGVTATIMKPGPPPRAAGKPPRARNSKEGANIRTIVYTVDKEKGKVTIGSMKLSGSKMYGGLTIPEIHEFGATVTVKIVRMRSTLTKDNLRKKKGQYTQKSTSMMLLESRSGAPIPMKMPKRPYLTPVFVKQKKKAAQLWSKNYKAGKGR